LVEQETFEMSRPDDRKYTQTHEWVKVDGDVATVGITDFAVQALNDLVFVDLPEVADLTEKGHPFAEVESVKAVADINAPISGEVTEINEDVSENLEKISGDCFGEGWLARVKMSNPGEVDELMDAAAYEAHVEAESD
jgi:glycine cleavage system H protein